MSGQPVWPPARGGYLTARVGLHVHPPDTRARIRRRHIAAPVQHVSAIRRPGRPGVLLCSIILALDSSARTALKALRAVAARCAPPKDDRRAVRRPTRQAVVEVPRLHPLPEAGPAHQRPGAEQRLGLLLPAPEATHQFTWLFGDRGIPASYRHMDGFGSHTFQWVNAKGEAFWVKYHFKTDQGIKCLTGRRRPRASPAPTPTTASATSRRHRARRVPLVDAEGADHAGGGGARTTGSTPST